VIGARTFPALDGAMELDGAIYAFGEAQAQTIIKALQAELIAARDENPALDEALFLKRRFPILIHRHWFDDDFFGSADGPAESFGVGAAEPLYRQRLADLQYFHIRDPQVQELAAFLHSSAAPTAMTIDRLHGFLCAVNCAPKLIRPQKWLPLIGGPDPMRVRSDEHSAKIIAALFALSNTIVDELNDGRFEPLLPSRPGSGMENAAQGWCLGFVEGMALQQRSWDQLMNEPEAQIMVVPILVLADASTLHEDATPNPAAIAGMTDLLPTAVATIYDYWTQAKRERGPARASRGRTVRTPSRTKGADAIGRPGETIHRLKITLEGIRPAIWRRMEIPSDAKLPDVSRVLITAMGWNDTHLHAFRVGSVTYGDPDPDFPTGMRSERSVTLAQIAPHAKDRFFFDYDFGDGWEHRVVVESIEPAEDSERLRCLGGARACPPDDCGGVGGYGDLLRILRNPRHPEYRRMRTWAGHNFDPESFDIDEVNRELRRLARPARKRSRR
jgi:yecA family protein